MAQFVRMAGAGVLAATALLCIPSPSLAVDQTLPNGVSVQLNGWEIVTSASDGTIALYRQPITSSPEGYRRIWERWEYASTMTDVSPSYASDIQYVEVDCAQRRMRTLQRNTYFRNNMDGNTGWSFSGSDPWSYIPPGTISEDMLNVACHRSDDEIDAGAPNKFSSEDIRSLAKQFTADVQHGGMMSVQADIVQCYSVASRERSKFGRCVAFDIEAHSFDGQWRKALVSQGHNDPGPVSEYFSDEQFSERMKAFSQQHLDGSASGLSKYVGDASAGISDEVYKILVGK